jgi:hypothetical protein
MIYIIYTQISVSIQKDLRLQFQGQLTSVENERFTRVCRIEPQAVGAWLKQTSAKSNFQHAKKTCVRGANFAESEKTLAFALFSKHSAVLNNKKTDGISQETKNGIWRFSGNLMLPIVWEFFVIKNLSGNYLTTVLLKPGRRKLSPESRDTEQGEVQRLVTRSIPYC